jgi:DNA-binding NarL/FixJ family response regulator
MRLVIVADHVAAGEAIRRELRHAAAFPVVDFVKNSPGCGEAVARLAPQVVVVDHLDDDSASLAAIGEVRQAMPEAKVVLLTADMAPGWLAELEAAGADAAISRTMKTGAVGLFVREVARGNVFHAFRQSARRNGKAAADLTLRELEILRRVAAGASNASIASEIWVTEQTVKFHLSNVYRKLGVANRTEASHYAHTHGLIDPPQPPTGSDRTPGSIAA